MGTHYKTLDEKCPKCDSNMIMVHMKNPFIDDFSDECPKCSPGEAFNRLSSWARSAAKAEQDVERDYEREERTNEEEE